MELLTNPIFQMVASLAILVYSAILHEIAHGYVADRFGDPTARLMGRLTLNPKSHIDPFLSIALPLLLILSGSPVIFGGAKPVPVDPFNLKDGRKDIALVSLAGPATNIILAIIAASLIHLLRFIFGFDVPVWVEVVGWLLFTAVNLNLLLAIFNLLPIPPLDGSKIFALLLPERQADAYLSIGSVGILLLFFLLLFPIGPFSIQDLILTLLMFFRGILGLS